LTVSGRRLVILALDFPPAFGGIQRLLAEVAAGLTSDWEVHVIAPAHPEAGAHDRAQGYSVHRMHASWKGPGRVVVALEMGALLVRLAPHTIVVGHSSLLPLVTVVRRRVPLIGMFYGGELWAPLNRRVVRHFGSRLDRAISISEFTSRQMVTLGIPAEKIQLTPLGADEATVPPDALQRLAALGLVEDGEVLPYFLTIARLSEPHKGVDVFLRAIPALRAINPRLRYVVAGGGSLLEELRDLAHHTRLDGTVLFAGPVHEDTKQTLLAHCLAFVMISREAPAAAQFEGFGLVYMEAALAGRPSIAGAAGAGPEVVRHMETGLVVDPRSELAAVEAGRLLLEDPALADRLGAAAERSALQSNRWTDAVSRIGAAIDRVAT
jgi:phosphatidylinositol alpha-1,6-mannosyltransferase